MEEKAMAKHITILGWLHIAHGLMLTLIAAIIFVSLMSAGVITALTSGDTETVTVLSIVALSISFFFSLFAIPHIVGGVGLLRRANWGRVVAAVAGILGIMNMPFGTAIGVYTIYVLFNKDIDRAFHPAPELVVFDAHSRKAGNEKW